jgi:hypothetical protein
VEQGHGPGQRLQFVVSDFGAPPERAELKAELQGVGAIPAPTPQEATQPTDRQSARLSHAVVKQVAPPTVTAIASPDDVL